LVERDAFENHIARQSHAPVEEPITTPTKSRASNLDERIMDAARSIARQKPLDHIGLSEIARLSGVSWPTVKRHLGSKQALRSRLASEAPELVRNVRNTRGRLLDSAARVFAQRGYERATLEEVASVAGLTKGAVYWHFESKADLFRALLIEYQRREAEFSAKLAERAHVSGDLEGLVHDMLSLELERLREAPEWARLPAEFVAAGRDEAVRAELARALRGRRAALAELVGELKQSGKASSAVEKEVATMLWSALVRGFLELAIIEPEIDLTATVREAARLLAFALGRRRTRASAHPLKR
jgi:AcrR family transcriptional regulator